MSYIDVAIPGAIGLLLAVSPQAMFAGSAVDPTPERLKQLRALGGVLLVVAGAYLALKLYA